mgnify:CR=1 FL=1
MELYNAWMIIKNYLIVNGKNDLIYNIMKNIKTFEGFFDFLKKKEKKVITDKLYESMERGSKEIISFFDNHSLEDDTEKEKDILRKYRKYKNIEINKFTDEYFTVVIYIQSEPLYFKCDTIDGVLQCLDDNKHLKKDNLLGN